MPFYEFGGLSVASDIPLEGLPVAISAPQQAADIALTLAEGPAPAADAPLFKWPGRYGLSLAAADGGWLFDSGLDAAFQVDAEGRRIRAYAAARPPGVGFMDVLARRVLPRIAILHEAIPIHAAALAREGGALLVSAPSGFGKSTFAARMAQRCGWSALSDDIAVLRRSGGTTTVSPTATGICLRPDSRRMLGLSEAECRSMPRYEDKLWFEPAAAPARAARLHAFVALARRADIAAPVLRPVAPMEGFMLATNQLIHFNPQASADGAIGAMMDRLAEALDGVPSYVLTCPNRFDALGAAADVLARVLE